MQGTCASCTHSFMMKDPGNGQASRVCRRYPPTVSIIPTRIPPSPSNPNGGIAPQAQSVPPSVSDEWCCGEFKSALVN